MRWRELDAEPCSVARTISVIGDRWTLLILRDCFLGVRRFEQFQSRLGITRHLLAARLGKLTRLNVLAKVPYEQRRHEYRLTAKGLDLYPVLLALAHWGDTHISSERGRPLLLEHRPCGQLFDPQLTCSVCGKLVHAHEVSVRPGPGMPAPEMTLLRLPACEASSPERS